MSDVKNVTVTDEDLLGVDNIELSADFSPLFDYVDRVVSEYKGFEDFKGNQKYCYVEVLSTALCFPNVMDFYSEDGDECSIWAPFDAICSAYWECHGLDWEIEDYMDEYDISYEDAEEMLLYRRAVAEKIFEHAERFHDKIRFTNIHDNIFDIAMDIMATREW